MGTDPRRLARHPYVFARCKVNGATVSCGTCDVAVPKQTATCDANGKLWSAITVGGTTTTMFTAALPSARYGIQNKTTRPRWKTRALSESLTPREAWHSRGGKGAQKEARQSLSFHFAGQNGFGGVWGVNPPGK